MSAWNRAEVQAAVERDVFCILAAVLDAGEIQASTGDTGGSTGRAIGPQPSSAPTARGMRRMPNASSASRGAAGASPPDRGQEPQSGLALL